MVHTGLIGCKGRLARAEFNADLWTQISRFALVASKGAAMSIFHVYRVVRCKGCQSPIDVEYLGPSINVRIAGVITNPGQLRCTKCGESHQYSGSDMQFDVRECAPSHTSQPSSTP